jgi:hypothetical protein
LFGGEQVLKAWVKDKIDDGLEESIPPILLAWYHATETTVPEIKVKVNGAMVKGT